MATRAVPYIDQRFGQNVDQRIVVIARGCDAQPLSPAGTCRIIDRLDVDALVSEQNVARFPALLRVSTQTLMDILEEPQRQRTAGTYRHLAKLMAELGWTAVRVRDFTRGRLQGDDEIRCSGCIQSYAIRMPSETVASDGNFHSSGAVWQPISSIASVTFSIATGFAMTACPRNRNGSQRVLYSVINRMGRRRLCTRLDRCDSSDVDIENG